MGAFVIFVNNGKYVIFPNFSQADQTLLHLEQITGRCVIETVYEKRKYVLNILKFISFSIRAVCNISIYFHIYMKLVDII